MWNKIIASLQFIGGLILWFVGTPEDACVALLMGIFWLLMQIVENTEKKD